jgi:Ca2+-binding RTX toxin-like protein
MCLICNMRQGAFGLSEADHQILGAGADGVAQGSGSVVLDYTALIGGYSLSGPSNLYALPGKSAFVTYSFPTALSAEAQQVLPGSAASHLAFDEQEKNWTREALAQWSDATGLTFLEVSPDLGQMQLGWIDFNTVPGNSGFSGFAYYPSGFSSGQYGTGVTATITDHYGEIGSDVFMNSANRSGWLGQRTGFMNVMLHEVGHAIGLKHPFESTSVNARTLDVSVDNKTQTIMSYTGQGNAVLGPLDIAAGVALYGNGSNDGANVASWNWNSTSFILTQMALAAGGQIRGQSLHDSVIGGAGADAIYTYAGNDTIFAGGGDDSVFAGDGDDWLNPGSGGGAFAPGNGFDTLDFTGLATAVTLQPNAVNADLLFNTGASVLRVRGDELEAVIGGSGNDNLGLNRLGTIATRLGGGAGDDTLRGGDGADRLDGGANTDTADFSQGSNNNGGVTVNLAIVAAQNTNRGMDTLISIENLLGSYQGDRLTGNALANRLDGNSGNDTLTGGAGDDTYVIDIDYYEQDIVIEAAGGGTDTIETGRNHTLATHLENLVLLGPNAFYGGGNGVANRITGNNLANNLEGFAGADTLDGGAGNDVMTGGSGDDTYFVDAVLDTVVESAGGGIDTIVTTVSMTVGADIENIHMGGTAALAVKGNAANNIIIGNAGANYLDGRSGADSLIGGAGNDKYIVDNALDRVVEIAGGGTDQVHAGVDTRLTANVEILVLLGSAALKGYGNNDSNRVFGNTANNTLYGEGGNDTLVGGLGADVMVGGAGADVFAYRSVLESGLSSVTRDRIADWSPGDRIDVSLIDANALLSGNNAFSLDAGGAFSAGEVRQTVYGAHLELAFNTDADAAAEMTILLVNRNQLLAASDFIL